MTTTPAFEPDYDALESEGACPDCGWVICVCDEDEQPEDDEERS